MALGTGSQGTGIAPTPSNASTSGKRPLLGARGLGGGTNGKAPLPIPSSGGFTPGQFGALGDGGMMLNQVGIAGGVAQGNGGWTNAVPQTAQNRAQPGGGHGAYGPISSPTPQPGGGHGSYGPVSSTPQPGGGHGAYGPTYTPGAVTGQPFPESGEPDYAAQAQSYYDALMGVANAENAGNNQSLALQAEFAKQQHDWAVSQAKGNYGYESQLLNNAGERADWDVNAQELASMGIENQQSYYGKRDENQLARYNTNLSAIEQKYGFNSREYNIAKQQLDAQMGYAGEQQTLEHQMAQLNFDKMTRQQKSDAIARGAMSSQGFGAGLNESGQEMGLAKGASNLSYRSTMSNLTAAQQKALLGFDATNADLDTSKANLGHDYTDYTNSSDLDKQQSDIELRQSELKKKQLESIANDYGIKADQMEFALTSGLEKLGMDATQAIAQITQMMASNDANLQAQASALIAQILGVSQ